MFALDQPSRLAGGAVNMGNIMRIMIASSAILLAFAQAALAADQATDLVLWGTLRAGMTKSEVKVAQPAKTIKLAERCFGVLAYGYQDSKLYAVEMDALGGVDDEACRVVVTKSLVAKYGSPGPPSTKIEVGNCGYGSKLAQLCSAMGGDKPSTYTTYNWTHDGVNILFRITDPGTYWSIGYEVDPQTSAETISKF